MAGDEQDGDEPSKSQLDKLGHRLREGSTAEKDLRALDDYRRSFRTAYDHVVDVLKANVGLEGTGRPAKTTSAIIDKLRRQPIRLTQIQDIAGIRLVVPTIVNQDALVTRLQTVLAKANVDDRRARPSHGYRAIHLVVSVRGKTVEVQVRTQLQHMWAELSEKLADVVDPAIKYGGGPEATRESLRRYAETVEQFESLEVQAEPLRVALASLEAKMKKLQSSDPRGPDLETRIAELKKAHSAVETGMRDVRDSIVATATSWQGKLISGEP